MTDYSVDWALTGSDCRAVLLVTVAVLLVPATPQPPALLGSRPHTHAQEQPRAQPQQLQLRVLVRACP